MRLGTSPLSMRLTNLAQRLLGANRVMKLHSGSPTCNGIMVSWNTVFLYKQWMFHFHLSQLGCKAFATEDAYLPAVPVCGRCHVYVSTVLWRSTKRGVTSSQTWKSQLRQVAALRYMRDQQQAGEHQPCSNVPEAYSYNCKVRMNIALSSNILQ